MCELAELGLKRSSQIYMSHGSTTGIFHMSVSRVGYHSLTGIKSCLSTCDQQDINETQKEEIRYSVAALMTGGS